MNDNLKQLLREASKAPAPPALFKDLLPEQPIEEKPIDHPIQQTFSEAQEEKQATSQSVSVNIIPLNSWFPANASKFENLKMVTISVRDVQPDIDLVVAVSDRETPDKKRLKIIESANVQLVLDLPGIAMSVFNSGFYILFSHPNFPQYENVFIKGYSLRNNLIIVSCLAHDHMLIPYDIQKVKKKTTTVNISLPPDYDIIQKLDSTLDRKLFEFRYHQSENAPDLPKVRDAIEWMLRRSAEMADISHLLQIDSVIMNTLK
jgi:hypothetical protein